MPAPRHLRERRELSPDDRRSRVIEAHARKCLIGQGLFHHMRRFFQCLDAADHC